MAVINNELFSLDSAGYVPINGMYVFYGTPINEPSSGATITVISSAVTGTEGAGMARCHGLLNIVSSGGKITYISTTANAELVAGVSPTPGLTVNAIGLAHLTPNAYNSGGIIASRGYLNDRIMDYTPVSGALVIPAGGYVTLVDNVTVLGS